MGGLDDTTWQALGLTLTLLGLALSALVWRRRGAIAGLRGVAWSLLPLAAALTGTLRLLWRIGDATVDWALRLVFSPVVWAGVVLAGVSLVLFVVTGVVRARRPETGRRRPAGEVGAERSAAPATATGSTDRQAATADDGLNEDDIEAILHRHQIISRAPGTADDVARHRLAARLDRAVAALPEQPPTPTVLVDLDAFDANAADLVRRAGGKPIRVATKSLRVPALIRRALDHPGFHGVLAYSLREALWLHREGVTDDLVMGYPTVDAAALRELTMDPAACRAITLMVDDEAHLDAVDAIRASDAVVRVALDVDAGLRLGGAHVGPRRSPLHDPDAVAALAREVVNRPGFALAGVMTYEGQVAGVPDDVPGERARSLAVRWMKRASVHQLAERRSAVAAALVEAVGPDALALWNAGGSGSLESSSADPVVTEVTAGSGLLVPALFDHYRGFAARPAAFFGLRVVRRPGAGCVTVAGGGLIASGTTGADRSPLPWAPPGLRLTALEGAGEVQTPLVGPAADGLRIGDLVWFRHAKSGEREHVREAHLVSGDHVVDVVPTYRGAGHAW